MATKRSPKGLFEVVTESGTLKLEQAISPVPWHPVRPGTYVIRPESGATESEIIKDFAAWWRDWAIRMIEADRKDPRQYLKLARGESLDRACVAAQLLVRLNRIEGRLVRGPSLGVIIDLFRFAFDVHQLTVVDNEVAIDSDVRSRRPLRAGNEGRAQKAKQLKEEYQSEADNIRAKNPHLKSDRAVAKIISERRGANSDTVRRYIHKK